MRVATPPKEPNYHVSAEGDTILAFSGAHISRVSLKNSSWTVEPLSPMSAVQVRVILLLYSVSIHTSIGTVLGV